LDWGFVLGCTVKDAAKFASSSDHDEAMVVATERHSTRLSLIGAVQILNTEQQQQQQQQWQWQWQWRVRSFSPLALG
jgi:hypothetical protein